MESNEEQRQPQRCATPLPPAPKLRAFHPRFRDRLLLGVANAFGLAAVEELPAYFLQELVFPARIGLAADLKERFGPPQDKTVRGTRRMVLNLYFGSFQYHQAILQCEHRMDLDLDPAGQILPDERARSMKILFDLKQQKLKKIPPPADS